MERIIDMDWVPGGIECAPPDPTAGGFVWVTFNPPDQPRKVIKLLSEFFPAGSTLDGTRSLTIRFVDGRPEIRFDEPVEVSAEVRAAAKQRAEDIAAAGGATLLTNADLDLAVAAEHTEDDD